MLEHEGGSRHRSALTIRSYAALLIAGLVLAGPRAAEARQTPEEGAILGRVVSAQVGAYLEGVRVRIIELDRQVETNREGVFSFTRVPAGTYTVTAAYMGLDARQIPVTVRPGSPETITVELSSTIFRLDEMIITSQIEGQGAAINLQRSSDNLTTIVPLLELPPHDPPARGRGVQARGSAQLVNDAGGKILLRAAPRPAAGGTGARHRCGR